MNLTFVLSYQIVSPKFSVLPRFFFTLVKVWQNHFKSISYEIMYIKFGFGNLENLKLMFSGIIKKSSGIFRFLNFLFQGATSHNIPKIHLYYLEIRVKGVLSRENNIQQFKLKIYLRNPLVAFEQFVHCFLQVSIAQFQQ